MGHNRAGDNARAKLKRRRREEKRIEKSRAEEGAHTTLAEKVRDAARAVGGKVGEMLIAVKEKIAGPSEGSHPN